MIQNETNGGPSGAPSTNAATLGEPGPVWYDPNRRSVHAIGRPVPARLVRSFGAKAWIALWLPEGRWKRLQAGHERLAVRLEAMDLDRAWAAGQEGGAPGPSANGLPIPGRASHSNGPLPPPGAASGVGASPRGGPPAVPGLPHYCRTDGTKISPSARPNSAQEVVRLPLASCGRSRSRPGNRTNKPTKGKRTGDEG